MQSFRQYRKLRDDVERTAKSLSKPSTASETSLKDVETQSDTDKSSLSHSPSDSDAETDHIIVKWNDDSDPFNPRNWSLSYRAGVFAILWINVLAVDWASSADSRTSPSMSAEFGVDKEIIALSSSLYTFGLATGSIFAGPISETVGRNPVYVFSRCFHVAWLLGVALAPNFPTLLVFRYLAGLSGSVLLAIHAASTADLFGPIHRTIAWPVIACASFWGTAFAPAVGGWIQQTGTDWRWTEWIAFILSACTLVLSVLFLPETFSPKLLSWKAAHLRAVTGDTRYVAELDLQKTFTSRLRVAALRAVHMITREPIVVLMGAWLVTEYVVVFGLLQGFTFIFDDTYGLGPGLTGTCFLAIAVGTGLWTLGMPVYYIYYKRRARAMYAAASEGHTTPARHGQISTGEEQHPPASKSLHAANHPGHDLPPPEYRLWTSVLAAPAFPVSLFWLGWTNYASVSPWSDLGAVTLLGFSWAGIYATVYQYILDVYGIYAGSALAMITACRYFGAGATNMFSRPMYDGIGVHWSMTLLGCVAALLMPAPVIFWFYGPRIRARSAFAGKYGSASRERVGKAARWT